MCERMCSPFPLSVYVCVSKVRGREWSVLIAGGSTAQVHRQDGIKYIHLRSVEHHLSLQFMLTECTLLSLQFMLTECTLLPLQIVNETNDFLAREESVSFGDGVTMASVQFYVMADSFAEGNETYIVRITDILGGGEISQPSSMLLVIMANDEPFGVVTFQESSQNIQVTEPIGGTPLNVELLLQRQPGIFGTVSVDWQVREG